MSFTNPLNAIYGNQKFLQLDDVDFHSFAGKANNLIQVDVSETGLTSQPATSLIPPVIGSGNPGDIAVFSGTVPILNDSNINIDTPFLGNKVIKTSTPTDNLALQSDQGAVSLNAPNGNIFLNANTSSGNIDMYAVNMQMISYGNISLSGNGGLTLQAGGGAQIKINNDGSIEINAPSGFPITINGNGGADKWIFSGVASGGSYTMPLFGGAPGSVLTNDGSGNLSWVGGP
jgi:hypothetical protein